MIDYITVVLVLYFISYFYYLYISQGIGKNAQFLQLRRFFPCALLAIFPSAIAQLNLSNQLFISSLFVGAMWIITYPLLYYNSRIFNFAYSNFTVDFLFFI